MLPRFRLLIALFAEAWPVWAGVGIPILAWYTAPYLLPGPKSIQYLGVAMESLGVIVVAYELIEIREQFDSPGVLVIVRRWLSRLRGVLGSKAPASDPTRTLADTAVPGNLDAASRANRSLPDQILAMMKIVDAMYRRLDTLQRLRQLEDRIANESQQATDHLQRLTSQIQTLSLGNIGREFVGASLIVLGLLLANLPEEFHHLWLAVTR